MTYEMILTALADPTRRAIFEDLSTSPSAVSVLAEGRPVSRPAVSQHLKVLEQAGLIKAQKRGTARIYHVTPQGLGPLRDYLDEMWGDALSAFAAETIKQSNKQTENEDA